MVSSYSSHVQIQYITQNRSYIHLHVALQEYVTVHSDIICPCMIVKQTCYRSCVLACFVFVLDYRSIYSYSTDLGCSALSTARTLLEDAYHNLKS